MIRSITTEDLYSIKFLSRPRISPDGQRVAYVVSTIDNYKYEYRSAIWVAPTSGGEPRRFTTGPANANSPSWSPDGHWLAFVSSRESDLTGIDPKKQKKIGKGKSQIWLMPADGGEARQLTFMEHGASSPVWSPDSKRLLFSAQVGPSDEEAPDGKPLPKVRVIDRLCYRQDGTGFIHERRSHFFLIDVAGGEPRQLTNGDCDNSSATWSPDGTQIAFVSNRNEDRWSLPGDDVHVLSFKHGQPGVLRQLTDTSQSCYSPSWSPDGQTIAFIASPKIRAAEHFYLYTVSANTKQPTVNCLSQEFEGSFMDLTNSDVGDDQLAPAPGWSADGKTLYVLASRRGSTRLYAIPSNSASKQPVTLTPGDVHVRDFSIDQSKNMLALLVADPVHPQEIFVHSTKPSAEMRRISYANDELVGELALSTPELITYAGADDWAIDGWIIKPPNFDPTKKYPLIVEIHGGPHTQYGYAFFHEMQLLAAQGYVVFYTNPRGSVGYGYDFANAVRKAWGEKPSIDILRGVDEVVKQGYIDEQRLGVIGGSYGGFMVNWLIGHSDRFKVAIADRSVSNMASMFGVSDIGWDFIEDHMEALPWKDLDKYLHMSPITYVQDIHTPLLLLHGEQDQRCNIEQAQQLFAALKYMERDVQLVVFEGQSHGLSRGGHPKMRLERLRHITNWFAKYLKS
ncbi:MAG TPA: S9 family peptidase [Ktedonobacteraceae bacterium]